MFSGPSSICGLIIPEHIREVFSFQNVETLYDCLMKAGVIPLESILVSYRTEWEGEVKKELLGTRREKGDNTDSME